MPLLVGLDCNNGRAAVYDVNKKTVNVYTVGSIYSGMPNLEVPLQKLCEYVKPTEVQRMVVSHYFSSLQDLQIARQKIVALGFKNTHFVNYEVIYVQSIINEKFIRSVENEHVLVTRYRSTTLWRFTNNVMTFINNTVNNADFMKTIRNVIRTYDVRRWFGRLNQLKNLAVHVVPGSSNSYTSEQLARVALWNAQRREGMVEGVLVENFDLCGPRIEVDGSVIYDKTSEGVAMPSQWVSDYVTGISTRITINYYKVAWSFYFKTKEAVKLQLCFDEDGLLDVKFIARQTANILFKNEQMYLAAVTRDASSDPSVIGPFATRLRFEKESVTVSENASGENILSGVLQMLDPSKPAEPGWELVNRFISKVHLPDGTDKEVDAQTAASHLLSLAVNKVSRPDEWPEELFIVVPEEFTDIHFANLVTAASDIGFSATIKKELDAVANGYAKKQKLQKGDRIVVVHPTIEGCKLKLFKVSDQQTEFEAEKFDAKMNCEVLRQSQRKWQKRVNDSVNPIESGAAEKEVLQLEHSSYSVVKGSEPWLEALRSNLQTLVPNENHGTVKTVLLVGTDARRLPLLNNLLFWVFPSDEVYTIVEEEQIHLAVIGADPKKPGLPDATVTNC